MGHSGEGKLLPGQGVPAADAGSGLGSSGPADRYQDSPLGGVSRISGQACCCERGYAAWEVAVDLAGDVTLEDADDLGLGAALFDRRCM